MICYEYRHLKPSTYYSPYRRPILPTLYDNKDLNLELTATGQLIILPGSGGEKGIQEANLTTSVGNWNHQTIN
ncbi:PDDEXK family nuclease [Sphaerospermopsis aphanizomenoides]|uniref:hypothetical protein n=1 Tax=Sphaerospermopsis aphanizomenoides TaxID=459663 RepID=UPI000A7E83FB|nr:hypothetical protein [Sphaerospermopsis aphanizomenoides]